MIELITGIVPRLLVGLMAAFICYMDLVRVLGQTPSRAARSWVLVKMIIEGGAAVLVSHS